MPIRNKIASCVSLIIIVVIGFSCSEKELPVINIVSQDQLQWYKTPVKLIYRIKNDSVELAANLRARGGVSSRYFKHSFAFELDEPFNFSELPEDDDWILNSNYIDKTFMRHKISYDLYRQMDSNNIASLCTYTNVELNNKPNGLYVLMQEITAKTCGLNKTDTLAMLFKDPLIFFREKPADIPDSINYYQQKYPKINISNKSYYLDRFRKFLFDSDDTLFLDSINYWVDINNITNWHIILLFTNNGDGIRKNFYLYKTDSKSPFRIAIWDYDHSFGRDGDNEPNMMERELDCNKSILLNRLMNIPQSNYKFKLKKRWVELRNQNIISLENFQKQIDLNHKIINGSIAKNFEIWPANDKWYFDDNNYHEELNLMVEFVNLRIKQLDEYFNSY